MSYRYNINSGLKHIVSRTEKSFYGTAIAIAGLGAAIALPFAAKAAGNTVVVTPANTQGWSTADTRPGGAVNYVSDATSPYPSGALQLTTDATNTAKAQYLHAADNVPLSDVNALSYYTKQNSGPAVADPSYQLAVDLNGSAAGGFTNLVYEPYWNGTVAPGTWQQWDVASGQFWSSSTFTDGTCSVVNGAGGPPFYTLADLQANCPDAVVVGYGVNIGTFNPNYNVETDGFVFNDTTYDFELTNAPTDKDACKGEGWQSLTDANGQAFKNQGQCVSYANHTNGVGQDDVHAKNR